MERKNKLICFFLLLCQVIQGQLIEVKGNVVNVNNKPLPNVAIIAYNNKDIVTYTQSNEKGIFYCSFKKEKIDSIKITASSLGFKTNEQYFKVTTKNTIKVNFILEESLEVLNEVVINSWEKIHVKKDTVAYKVTAFKDGSERVVEDLLKNIPGIEVNPNGIIKVNGKAIDKLLIEGDDLFDSEYKLLSKNLDASVINQVEVLNNFEDNPVLKKFQNSEKVAINLKVKATKKNIWFGNLDIGLGTNNNYNSLANIGLIKKKIKFFNLTNANSIGNTAMSKTGNNNTIRYSNYTTSSKIEKNNYKVVDIDNVSSNNFSKNEDVFNNSLLNSLSFVTKLSKKTSLRSLTYFSLDKINKQNASYTEYLINTTHPISFTEKNKFNTHNISFATNLELKYRATDNTYINYDATFEKKQNEVIGGLLFNTTAINQIQNDKQFNAYNHLNITKQLFKNKMLFIYAYHGVNNTEQLYTVQPNLLLGDNSQKNTQKGNTPLNYYGLVSEITSKNKNAVYGLKLAYKVDKDEIYTDFRLEDDKKVDTLSNKTTYKNAQISLQTKFNYKLSKLLRLNTSISFAKNSNELNNKKKNLFFINPKVKIYTKKTKVGNFGFSYSFQNTLPQAKYLTSNYMLKNYRVFVKGAPTIQQNENHSFGFYYTFNNYKKQFLINSFLLRNFSNISYGVKNIVSEKNNLTQFDVLKGGDYTNYNLSITKYLRSIASTLKVSTHQSWLKNQAIINTSIGNLKNYNAHYRLQGTTYFKLPLNFKFGFQYNYTKGGFNKRNTTNTFTESSFSGVYKIKKEWLFKIENQHYFINKKNYWFTNFNINYTPIKQKVSYKLTFNNIHNVTRFKDVFVSDFQRNESSYNLIPRYIVLNVKYRF